MVTSRQKQIIIILFVITITIQPKPSASRAPAVSAYGLLVQWELTKPKSLCCYFVIQNLDLFKINYTCICNICIYCIYTWMNGLIYFKSYVHLNIKLHCKTRIPFKSVSFMILTLDIFEWFTVALLIFNSLFNPLQLKLATINYHLLPGLHDKMKINVLSKIENK